MPESHDRVEKPEFFFGDRIEADDSEIYIQDSNLLGQVNGRFLFLPSMKQMYPLSYFQSVSLSWRLRDYLVEDRDGVSTGILTHQTVHPIEIIHTIKGLQPGEFNRIDLDQEKAVPANIFIRQFIAAGGEFPAQNFRAPGWTYSHNEGWWVRLIDFINEELRGPLVLSGLESAVVATRRGIVQSSYNFFAILEKYNPDSCTFFTPVGELGLALHEMYAISGLPYGELPYDEIVPGNDELSFLKSVYPDVYATFWEVMCHFHICAQLSGYRSGGLQHMSWAEYLFQNLHNKNAAITRLPMSSPEVIAARIRASDAKLSTIRADLFSVTTEFESFHYQAEVPISDKALLAGFFMIWLKRCVVPSRPIESILAEVVYPAVLLAHGRPVSLLSAMVSNLQYGLRELTSELLNIEEIGPAGNKRLKTPQPRVPMPYTYLMAWLVMHCPSLMTEISEAPDFFVPFVQRLRSAQWAYSYIVSARQVLSVSKNYTVFCCAPDFDGTEKKITLYMDVGTNMYTSLYENIFLWLLTIRPGYLTFRLGERCIIEPYLPSRFARQFGYDQLYVGNPNPKLATVGDLYEGARAWYYWITGNSMATFTLPPPSPKCYAVSGFCDWYREASKIPEYNMYTSCLKDIRAMYESRKGSKLTRLKGVEEFLACEEALEADIAFKEAEGTETPEETQGIEASTGRAKGKRALTAKEETRHEKRFRRQSFAKRS